jgi:hypothetical protein
VCINTDTIHEYINQIYKNLQLNPTHENNGSISFLDLLIIINPSNLESDIYRKPTTIDTTIDFLCNHPTKHKITAYLYHIARMHSLPLTLERQQAERKTIQPIAQSNNFPEKLITNLRAQMQHKKTYQIQDKEKNKNKKCATFTYHTPKIRKITNLFKHTDIGIAFKSKSTIQQLTKPKISNNTQDHNRSGIYKLTCNTCKMSYIGQTTRNLKQICQEHIRYIRNNNPQSVYAQHIL